MNLICKRLLPNPIPNKKAHSHKHTIAAVTNKVTITQQQDQLNRNF